MYDGWKMFSFLNGLFPIVVLLFLSSIVAPTGKGHGHRPPDRRDGPPEHWR